MGVTLTWMALGALVAAAAGAAVRGYRRSDAALTALAETSRLD